MTDAARAARILHGIERILDERTTPIPPRLMQQALRVARGALEGPMTAERRAVEAAIREPAPAQPARRGRPRKSPEEQIAARRARQAAWKREKTAKLRAAKKAETRMEIGAELAPAAAEAAEEAAKEAAAIAEAERVDAALDAAEARAQALPVPPASAPAAPEVSAAVAAPMPVVPAQMVPIPPVRLSDRRHMGRWLIGMQQRLRLNREGLAERIGLPLSVFRALPQGTLVNQETSQRVVEAWLDREAPGWRDAAPPASVAASSTPNAPKPPALGQLEPVPASIKDAEDWLYEEVVRERGKRANHAEIEARIAMFTPDGLLREVNARRLKHGLPPYVISGRAA